jgi:hypothetical protein
MSSNLGTLTANPYISRGPVRNADMFYGREHELHEIAAFLNGNQSISLVGPRKIGKTSLLFHLMRPEIRQALGLTMDNNILAYLDCELLGESSVDEIFGQFAAEIAAVLADMGLPAEPAIDAVIAKPNRLGFETAIRRLNQRKLRVVLLMDEFERISTNTALDINFFNALRSAAGRYQLVFITASARPLIELTYSERSREILSSPFFNIFAPMFLGLLPETEARQLIAEPAQRLGLPFNLAQEDFLYSLAGGHPLALQVACFHAFHTEDDQGVIEERAKRELSAHFQYYWHNLSEIEQDTLRRLGEAASKAHSDTTLRAALRDLVQKCLLVTHNDTYAYPSQSWADFVGAQDIYGMKGTRITTGLLTGSRIGSYEVLELLGRGGMAEVYRGRHTRLERTVAIKVLSANLAAEGDFRKRFEREARAIATLKHPNIVGVFDFGDVEGIYYMVMEYISGQTLAQFLQQAGVLALDQALPLMRDLSSALDYAHAQRLVHRDIKPSNVMLDPVTAKQSNSLGLRAILTDFGIAKLLRNDNEGGPRTDELTGTLDYIAPEQIRSSSELDGRADIYALGVMFYQILTGHLPFTSDNPATLLMAHLQDAPPDPREFNPALPHYVARALLRALAKTPADRYTTAGELVNDLE